MFEPAAGLPVVLQHKVIKNGYLSRSLLYVYRSISFPIIKFTSSHCHELMLRRLDVACSLSCYPDASFSGYTATKLARKIVDREECRFALQIL